MRFFISTKISNSPVMDHAHESERAGSFGIHERPERHRGGQAGQLSGAGRQYPIEAVRRRADVLVSIRNWEYLFNRPEPRYDIVFDLFNKTRQRSHQWLIRRQI
ncbi:MAG: hypothetical protein HS101_19705 [Planctomycetia bacterium]|jgi:hypothetical protein|nr:hypothetical protein [Planctomycetia bacterium]MCC7316384.1 hypothetical protein [Planctomycetota bacterium]OQY98497.1 MAG: hypothetical protein B6D36_17485 [Planctomycetes bacterium UTPLA1]